MLFLKISGHFGDPNDNYIRIKILAPDRQIGPPVRFLGPPERFSKSRVAIRRSRGFPNPTKFSDPQYVSCFLCAG